MPQTQNSWPVPWGSGVCSWKLPTHTSQHLRVQLGPGAEDAELLWNWAIVFCSVVVPSEVLWLQLHKQIPSSDLKDHALNSSEKPSLCNHFCLPSLPRGSQGDFLHRTAIFFRWRLWVGTQYFNVIASQGGCSPILPGGKKRKAFFSGSCQKPCLK